MSKFRLNIVMEIINNLWINSYLRGPAMVNKSMRFDFIICFKFKIAQSYL
jgi:hypothetical protein